MFTFITIISIFMRGLYFERVAICTAFLIGKALYFTLFVLFGWWIGQRPYDRLEGFNTKVDGLLTLLKSLRDHRNDVMGRSDDWAVGSEAGTPPATGERSEQKPRPDRGRLDKTVVRTRKQDRRATASADSVTLNDQP